MLYVRALDLGTFQIATGWWGHQPGQTVVVGVLTDHDFRIKATIRNAPGDFYHYLLNRNYCKLTTRVSPLLFFISIETALLSIVINRPDCDKKEDP